MNKKIKNCWRPLLTAIVVLTICTPSYSQGFLDKMKKKKDELARKVANTNKSVDGIFKSDTEKQERSSNEEDRSDNAGTEDDNKSQKEDSKKSKIKSEPSIITEADFVQNTSFPEKTDKDTRFRIADDLSLDIEGKYPSGHAPKWRFLSYKSALNFDIENYVSSRSELGRTKINIAIGNYKGKAMLRLNSFIGCDCFAEIIVKDPKNVLSESPQTFQLTNFQKILNERITGEPCVGANKALGGWEGELTLSSSSNGDIKMNVMLERFKLENRFREAGVAYRYIAKNIVVENEMSAKNANEIVAAEEEAKRKHADYLKRSKIQIDSLQKVIAKKYPQKECRECFSRTSDQSLSITPTKDAYRDNLTGDVYIQSGTEWDVNTRLSVKNKCNYNLTFIGIQQLFDEEAGYYFKEVTTSMPANYEYETQQGLMSMLFTSMVGDNQDIYLQKQYDLNFARLNSIQWIKVVKE